MSQLENVVMNEVRIELSIKKKHIIKKKSKD